MSWAGLSASRKRFGQASRSRYPDGSRYCSGTVCHHDDAMLSSQAEGVDAITETPDEVEFLLRCPYPEAHPAIRRDNTRLEWKLKDWVYSRSNLAIVTLCNQVTKQAKQSMLNRFAIHQIPTTEKPARLT
jgi:hypothetical protein